MKMKRFCAFLVFATSCSPESPYRSATCTNSWSFDGRVKDAFHAWREAEVSGDPDRVFEALSTTYKSTWFSEEYIKDKGDILAWRNSLHPADRDWLSDGLDRVGLPEKILNSAFVRNLWRRGFSPKSAEERQFLAELELIGVAHEDYRATVVARSPSQGAATFEFVRDHSDWKAADRKAKP